MNYIDNLAQQLVEMFLAGYTPQAASAEITIDHAQIMNMVRERAFALLETYETVGRDTNDVN